VIGLNAPMPDVTRRLDPDRADCWLIRYGDVHIGTIARRVEGACLKRARRIS